MGRSKYAFGEKIKKLTFFILLAISFTSALVEVAIIQDPDGWTNIREQPNILSKVLIKVYENQVFWYDEPDIETEWIEVFIPKNDFSLACFDYGLIRGYIHQSKLKPLRKLRKYNGDQFRFSYHLKAFEEKFKKIDWQDNGSWIKSINGMHAWGTDDNIPKIEVAGMAVKYHSKTVPIGRMLYEDLFECTNDFDTYVNGETFFVYQWNSDGAGAYAVVWVFNNGELKQRFVGTI